MEEMTDQTQNELFCLHLALAPVSNWALMLSSITSNTQNVESPERALFIYVKCKEENS